MAINVSNLTTYVDEQRLPLIRKAVLGARTAYHFNLMTGVKGATALNLLSTEVEFGDGNNCGWNEAGESTLSQRVLTPGAIAINMSFCDKKLLKTWANHEVRVAAGQKALPFEEDFMAGVGEAIASKIEIALWQGDTTSDNANLNKFDGMIKILEGASVAATKEYSSSDSVSKIVSMIYGSIPSEAFNKGEVVLYMGADKYRAYIQELIANGNLVITTGVNDVAMPDSVLIPGTNVRVIYVDGLNGTGKFYASYKDNFVYGVDMTDDSEKYDFWYSQDNREHRLAVEFVAGVQVAYPDMVVVAKEEAGE
jgi:hypothetical protein